MNTFQIKVIAIIFMVIDHLGLFFFPQFFWLRIIGRLSFPLFAWLIANGANHTRDIKKYLFRLYAFALLSQIPFFLTNRLIDPQFSNLNVLCTLFLGLTVIYFIQTSGRKLWILIALLCIVLAQVLQTDYGGFGVAVVVCFYLFYRSIIKLILAQFLVFFFQFLFFQTNSVGLIEQVGLLSLIFIAFYNHQPGPRAKYLFYLFYLFYPLQYVVYYFLLL